MGHGDLPGARRWGALLALAALLLSLVPQFVAAQSPTTFTAAAQAIADGRRIKLDGRLLSGEAPVGKVDVHVTLGAVSVGSTGTNSHGEFRLNFSVPDAHRTGVQSVGLRFDGDGQFAPTSAQLPVVMVGDATTAPAEAPDPPSAPAAAEPVAPPADLRPATALTLSVRPEDPRPGELLTLTGRLTVADTGVPQGRIEVRLGGHVSPDSLTYTDDAGRFTTYLEVPADHPASRTRVEVGFADTAAHLASTGAVAITVREPLPTATPTPTPTEAPPSAPDAQNQTIRTATSTAAATTTPAPTPASASAVAPQEDGGSAAAVASPVSGVFVAMAAVGGSSLLVAVALLIRRLGRSEVDGDLTGFLTDDGSLWDDDVEADDSPGPRRGRAAD